MVSEQLMMITLESQSVATPRDGLVAVRGTRSTRSIGALGVKEAMCPLWWIARRCLIESRTFLGQITPLFESVSLIRNTERVEVPEC
jgi:hypothetical protein